VICPFSVASLCITISYLMIGCILYEENSKRENSYRCRTRGYIIMSALILFISSAGFIILMDLKIYDYLIASAKFITIPWSAALSALIIAHMIILTYYSFVKAPDILCEYLYIEEVAENGFTFFVGWDRCPYFILELSVSLKLDRFLFEGTNWLFILIPAYLVFVTRVAFDLCSDNDTYTWWEG
jgi:hypothetical protein